MPIGGSYHPLPTNKDMKVRVPSHPANTGSEDGLYGKPTRNLSETQLKHPPAVNATKRDARPGTTDYNLDPLGKAGTSPFLQSGTYRTAKNTTELPAIACNWEWHQERDVPSRLSETAYSYAPGKKRLTWGIHFGLMQSRRTFGKMKSPMAAHSATASLAHKMAMDPQLFSTFRTTEQPSCSTPAPRSVPVWSGKSWADATPLLSQIDSSRGSNLGLASSRSSQKIRTAADAGAPDPVAEHYCLPHNLLGCLQCSKSERTRKGIGQVEVLEFEDHRPRSRAQTEWSEVSDRSQSFSQQLSQPSTAEAGEAPAENVSSVLSSIDFGRVRSPAEDESGPNKFILARSCRHLDGTRRSLVVLPEKWMAVQHLIKDEKQARQSLGKANQRKVLREAPKHIMRNLHAQMREHPDTPWQPLCFPLVQ